LILLRKSKINAAGTGAKGREVRRPPAAGAALRQRGHVTFAEIGFGIELVEDVSRRSELQDWLSQRVRPMFAQRALPVTEDIMLRWRLLVEAGRKVGHTFSQPDLIIAATALHHGLTVVTRNESDYDRAGVSVLNPWSA
jgi:hypothetical protein